MGHLIKLNEDITCVCKINNNADKAGKAGLPKHDYFSRLPELSRLIRRLGSITPLVDPGRNGG